MKWQMIVLMTQLVAGGALVVVGFRRAAHYWLARRDKAHAEYLAKALGEPQTRSPRPIVIGILMALAGGLLLATVDATMGWLLPGVQ